MSEYPEHEKLHRVSDKSQAIGEFIDWLSGEKNIFLARHTCPGHMMNWDTEETIHEDIEDCTAPRLVFAHQSIERLLGEFFEIDLNVLEEEKRAMLAAQRALSDRVASHETTTAEEGK